MREKQNFLKKKVIYIYIFYIKPVIFWFAQKKFFGLFVSTIYYLLALHPAVDATELANNKFINSLYIRKKKE